MKNTLFVLLFLLFTSIPSSYAHISIDSLRVVWEDETQTDSARFDALRKYTKVNSPVQPDSTLIHLDYYYQLAKKKGANRHVYRALNQKANIYRNKGELEKALNLYKEAEVVAKQLENRELQAIITGNIGNVFLFQQQYLEANRRYTTALKFYQEQQNKEGEARILSALGSVYLEIGNYDLGLEYYQKSSIIYKEIKAVESAIAVVEMNIGLLQFRIKAYSEAKSSFEKALDLLQVDNNKFLTAGCYSLLAKIHLELNQLEEANVYAKKNLYLNKELDIESGVLESKIIIAQITYKINIDSATKKGKLILTHLPNKTSKELKKELYELLYKCSKSQNNLGLSLKMHELFKLYQDSIQIEKNSYAVIRETVKTDYELRIAENKLESQKRKAELEVKQLKRTFGIISISSIIISLLIFFLFSMSKKNKKRRNQLLEEIKKLKRNTNNELVLDSNKFDLSREKIELKLDRKLNETDWKVLNLLLDDPSITNKEIAERAFLSLDGIGSTLRRMYEYFEIKESKYKKILLLLEAIKVSNAPAPNSDI